MPNKNSLSFTNDTLVTSFCLIGLNHLRTTATKEQRSYTIDAAKKNFYGCSSCGEVSKLGLRNSNRISELQHQNTTLTKELQVIKRLLENK